MVKRLTLGVLLLFLLICGSIVWVLRVKALSIPQVSFNAKVWQASDFTTSELKAEPSERQKMIADLTRKLPNLSREEIESLLGASATHEEMRRMRPDDLQHPFGNDGSLLKRGEGHYYDEYDWDLIYPIGTEHKFIWDHDWQLLEAEGESLIIRLDPNGKFQSWFIVGSDRWPDIVGPEAASTYKCRR